MIRLIAAFLIIFLSFLTAWSLIQNNHSIDLGSNLGALQKKNAETVHFHAGFNVVVDGLMYDYSAYQYMHTTPCSASDYSALDPQDPFDRAHLHENVGDVVHVHYASSTWRELLQGINQNELLKRTDVQVISENGSPRGLDSMINEYQSVFIIFGEIPDWFNQENPESTFVPKSAIISAESSSELCGQ